jgi:hypothetical protein
MNNVTELTPPPPRHRQGFTYKRIGRYWHRLDAVIDGRRMTFFDFSRAGVFKKAEDQVRSTQDFLQLVACQEQAEAIAFTDSRVDRGEVLRLAYSERAH